jgi:hypothetical protein
MSPNPLEVPPEHHFEQFNDLQSYNNVLQRTMQRAEEIIALKQRGLTEAEREALKVELPILVRTLRHLLNTQLDHNGVIAKTDAADGSYDNADVDERLRQQLTALRNLNTDVSRMFGTRTIRKISSAFTEDLPNWFGIKWREAKDNLKHVLKTTAIVGGLTAAGLLGGYALYNGGIVSGASMLGSHLQTVGGYIATGASAAWAGLSALKRRIFG